MQKKKLHLSKRYNSAFFKYTNQQVFDRREKLFLENKKGKKRNNKKYLETSRNGYTNLKQKLFNEKNIFQYLKTLQLLNSNDNDNNNNGFFQTITNFNEINKKYTIKNKENSIKKNNLQNLFNLTETNIIKQKKRLYNNNSTKNNLTINFQKFFNIKDEKNYSRNKQKLIINDYNYKGIKELLLIKKEKELNDVKNNEDKEKSDGIKTLKLFQFNCLKEGSREYIKKTNNYNTINYSYNTKKERIIRLEEIYNNNNGYYKYSYNSLLNSKKLFNKFMNQISEYLKFLSMKIKKEILENSKLINEILNLKNEIEVVGSKIKKTELEKNNIIRWLYFQIQLKEKKLNLPDYYKVILEYNNINNRNFQKQSIRKKKVMGINYNDLKKNNDVNNEDDNVINNFVELNGINIKIEEYKKIKAYKNKLIYETPELFNEALLNLENNILKLIKYQDSLRENILFLKKEFYKVENEKNTLENYINNKLKNNESELNKIKTTLSGKTIFNNCFDNINKKKDSIIFIKIMNIYENLKTIEKNNKNKNKNKNILEKDIINILKYIEVKTDELINNVNSYNKDECKTSMKSFIFKIKLEIDKNHKKEKAELQKIKQRERYIKLYEEIEAKNNKIYTLPRKKLDISRIKSKQKKVKIIKKEKKEESNLDDFLHE